MTPAAPRIFQLLSVIVLLSCALVQSQDSPRGPLYLAYGRTDESHDAIYFSLGWPFLTNNTVLGR